MSFNSFIKRISFHLWSPVKTKEAEGLAEAVRLENRRLRAYEAQQRSAHPRSPVDALVTTSQGGILIRAGVFHGRP